MKGGKKIEKKNYKFEIGEEVILKQFGLEFRKKVIKRKKSKYGNVYLLQGEVAWVFEGRLKKLGGNEITR